MLFPHLMSSPQDQMQTGLGSRLIFFRLRLLVFFEAALAPHFFSSGSGSSFFFNRLRLQGAKKIRLLAAPALNYWRNIFSPTNY